MNGGRQAGSFRLYIVRFPSYSLNTIAASCVFISVLFDVGVWYYAKDLKMYDDEDAPTGAEAEAIGRKDTELTDLGAVTDADVLMSYKTGHRGSDVCT